ncbi:MAG: hypothetical protein KGL39_51910 [Patescibacteria group bacterium]|nr:hypothetical protein [Patescibacteria group bacterium]
MAYDRRALRAIREIDCPRCNAPAGTACRSYSGRQLNPRHDPACCQERRTANQERRRREGLAGPVQTPPGWRPERKP